jgi:hypothetical protein
MHRVNEPDATEACLERQFGDGYEMVTGKMVMNHVSHILTLYFTWLLRCTQRWLVE